MKQIPLILPARLRRLLGCVAVVAAGVAQAAVVPTVPPGPGGGMQDIHYGGGGNVFQLEPMLFVLGLGAAGNPLAVSALNPGLQYSFSVAGSGTSLFTIDYRISNISVGDSFSDLRFMLFTNPDGDSTVFQDTLKETWGVAVAGDPVLREGRDFNPVDTIVSRFILNNNLTELPSPYDACLSGAGCDATVGMQWNAASLGPGETFRIRVGLSDNGQHLSARWIDVTAVNTANTVLTLSGVSSIIPVPEPEPGWMLAAGLAVLGGGGSAPPFALSEIAVGKPRRARTVAWVLGFLPIAFQVLVGSGPGRAGAAPTRPAAGAASVSAGSGAPAAPARPRSVAEARAVYAETVRKCRLLSVAAVRDECLREAARNLDQELERLQSTPESGR